LIPPAKKPVMPSKKTEPSEISKNFSCSKAGLYAGGCQRLSSKKGILEPRPESKTCINWSYSRTWPAKNLLRCEFCHNLIH
jgi:hypothetical protein